jgi:hypothetical protein
MGLFFPYSGIFYVYIHFSLSKREMYYYEQQHTAKLPCLRANNTCGKF